MKVSLSSGPLCGLLIVTVWLLSCAPALAGVESPKLYPHHFQYVPDPADAPPQFVAVAGDFNSWSTSASPMHRAGDGSWVIDLPLTADIHQYKFYVDGHWLHDPKSDTELEASDGYGGKNSAVLIGPDARHFPPPAPGQIVAELLTHDVDDVEDQNVASPQMIRLGLKTQAGNLDHATIVWAGADHQWQRVEMSLVTSHMGIDQWNGLVQMDSPQIAYFFEMRDQPTTAYYAGGKMYLNLDEAASHAYQCDMTPAFQTPDWAKHAIWYQIFPERFRNGDPANDPPGTQRWTSSWFSKLPGESGRFYNDVWNRRYGGDFQGIDEELPYLRSLGINCIYLNPIFKARDLHKYDTSDYRHVDDHFGYAGDIDQLVGETDDPATWQWTKTDKLFLSFLADAHKQGFHVIIDGVFNHVGVANYAFQDVMKNGRQSRYADWFEITSWSPFHWTGWGGAVDGGLPEFRKDPVLGLVHGPRELVMDITKRWLAPNGDPSLGVDGFRLDACENIPRVFWVDWRKLVKSIKPDAYVSGEIWSICPTWLTGDTFDATMQYPFAEASEAFFVDQKNAIPPSVFGQRIGKLTIVYPFQISLVQMNLLDSHDTDRWASRFVNPDLPFNGKARIQDNNPDYNTATPDESDWTRMKQSIVPQMTYVGSPMIYYGDETGMWGPSDPSDREPMIWKDLEPYDDTQVTFRQDLFDWYQRLIAIRRKLPALQIGFAHSLLADDSDGVYAFSRDLGNQHVCVIVNRSAVAHDVEVPFGSPDGDISLLDWIDPAEANLSQTEARPDIEPVPSAAKYLAHHGQLTVKLGPWGSMILSPAE